MKKINKDLLYNIILVLIAVVLVLLTVRSTFIYGSNVDWLRQHVAFPDYFRNLFYETHNLFPNFGFHLGGGQNIFYFAYYGLYSPIVLLSYLFPSIQTRSRSLPLPDSIQNSCKSFQDLHRIVSSTDPSPFR